MELSIVGNDLGHLGPVWDSVYCIKRASRSPKRRSETFRPRLDERLQQRKNAKIHQNGVLLESIIWSVGRWSVRPLKGRHKFDFCPWYLP